MKPGLLRVTGARSDSEWQFQRTPRLTRDEEISLSIAAKAGDTKARAKLIESNMELVGWVVARIKLGRLSTSDAMGAGMIGLVNAVDKFEPTNRVRLATYASYAIRNEIMDAVWDAASPIRRPNYIQFANAQRKQGKEIPQRRIDRCREALAIASMTQHDASIREIEVDCDPSAVVERAEQVEQTQTRLHAAISHLPANEATVLRLRFGLDGPAMNGPQVARMLKLTKQAVNLVEHRAMRKLRGMLGA